MPSGNAQLLLSIPAGMDPGGIADEFVQIEPGGDYAVLSALRAIVRGKESIIPKKVAGIAKEQAIRIAGDLHKRKVWCDFFWSWTDHEPGKIQECQERH